MNCPCKKLVKDNDAAAVAAAAAQPVAEDCQTFVANGFDKQELNAEYTLDQAVMLNKQPTFWSPSRSVFLFWCAKKRAYMLTWASMLAKNMKGGCFALAHTNRIAHPTTVAQDVVPAIGQTKAYTKNTWTELVPNHNLPKTKWTNRGGAHAQSWVPMQAVKLSCRGDHHVNDALTDYVYNVQQMRVERHRAATCAVWYASDFVFEDGISISRELHCSNAKPFSPKNSVPMMPKAAFHLTKRGNCMQKAMRYHSGRKNGPVNAMAKYERTNGCAPGTTIPLTYDLHQAKSCAKFWAAFNGSSKQCNAKAAAKPHRFFMKGQGFGGKQIQVIDPCIPATLTEEMRMQTCPSEQIASREIVPWPLTSETSR
jgi:hypothetical protein